VILRQILNTDLGCASYLIADSDAGVAVVVDPRADISAYVDAEAELGVRITDVIETHNHADHVSGRPALVARGAVTARIHRLAQAGYPHAPFADGDVIDVGAIRLTILHTPGHRPEHCAVIVTDSAGSSQPVAVLTGDSLFVGDVARPDLAIEPREGARELHESLERLAALPDLVEVLPAHIGGSLCGSARMSTDTRSTIGAQRRQNEMFTKADEQAFVDALTSGLAPQPPNFRRIVARNQGVWDVDAEPPPRIDATATRELQAAGATVIDGRGIEPFDAGHIPGSVGVPEETTGFGTKAAWIVDPDGAVVLVGTDGAQADRMALALRAVAVDRPLVLAGGVDAWAAAGFGLRSVPTVDVDELEPRWRSGVVQVLDVRERDEWEEFHVPASLHVPYHEISRRLDELDATRPIACLCSGGVRSGVAVGLLQREGFEAVHVLDGTEAWRRQGYPVESGPVAA
jgi:rhodanese-related sulfurtransferase/glyoxylase-like metal-dependent hydrolase (beta-lactamase superfamily II)